jgi:hypothetical protein
MEEVFAFTSERAVTTIRLHAGNTFETCVVSASSVLPQAAK